MTWPRGIPAPAANIDMAWGQWSRPASLFTFGVRPNSPMTRLAGELAAGGDFWGEDDIAHFEALAVGIAFDDEGGMLSAQEIGAAGAGHFRGGHVGGEAFADAALPGDDRAVGGVKGDERAAAD